MPNPSFEPLKMFVATLEAQLTNLHLEIDEAIEWMEPSGPVLAINCNYGHKSKAGWEKYKKLERKKKKDTNGGRERKMQGDGTCFNSALEPVVQIGDLVPDDKFYYMKCFTSTGQTQVPGTLMPDLSDGRAALQAWVDFLNESSAGDPDGQGGSKKIEVKWSQANMINFKSQVRRTSPRVLLNLHDLARYLQQLEDRVIVAGKTSHAGMQFVAKFLPEGTTLVAPPFQICETKPPIEDVKLSFRIAFPDRKVRVNIFQRCKINILGADSLETGQTIYDWLRTLFETNWSCFVRLQPRRDSERFKVVRQPTRPISTVIPPSIPRVPQVFTMTDEEVEIAIYGDMYEEKCCNELYPKLYSHFDSRAVPTAPLKNDGPKVQIAESSNAADQILAMADEFGDYSDDESDTDEDKKQLDAATITEALQDLGLDEMDGKNVEHDNKDSLQDGSVRGGTPAPDRAAEPREDPVGEDRALN